jgi:hypothetical protein
MEGWVKLHRCLIDKPIFDNANLLKVWIWCLCKATHKQHIQLVGLQKIELNIGQFITGRNAGSIELKLKPSTFWDYMKFLKDNKSININSNSKFSVVTVENWVLYQVDENISDSETDNKPTAIRQPSDTNKNDKTVKNDKKNIYGDEFDSFWNLYPKKASKKDAIKAWNKIKLTEELIIIIADGLKKAIRCTNWVKDGGQFIPNAATWLNGERWKDEVQEAQTELFKTKEKLSVADKAKELARKYELRHGIKTSDSYQRDIPLL